MGIKERAELRNYRSVKRKKYDNKQSCLVLCEGKRSTENNLS